MKVLAVALVLLHGRVRDVAAGAGAGRCHHRRDGRRLARAVRRAAGHAGRAQKAFGSGAPADRLRLATLLATLPPPLRDDARAAELLEPIADAGAPGVGRFAALLSAQVIGAPASAARGRALRAEGERAGRERALADKERDKREEALKQQLEALRAIERGILEREETLRGENEHRKMNDTRMRPVSLASADRSCWSTTTRTCCS